MYNSLYSTGDSLEYLEYSQWLNGETSYCNPVRTFFYPLLILISTKLFGYYGLWILQFLLWLFGCILIYITVKKITNEILAVISFLIAVINISLICYTAFALTEVTAFFLLAFLSYLISNSKGSPFSISFILVLSILVTVKPFFLSILYFITIAFLIINFKNIYRRPILILMLILSLSPIIIQKSINKIEFGTVLFNTHVADINLKQYFYRKTKYYVENSFSSDFKNDFNNLSANEVLISKNAAMQLEKQEIIKYLIKHKKYSIMVYWDNLKENLKSGNPYLDSNLKLKKLSNNINSNFIFRIHLIMLFLWLYFIIVKIKLVKTFGFRFVLWNGIFAFFILYSSGISFWAGDRLVVSATSVCCILYSGLIYRLKNNN